MAVVPWEVLNLGNSVRVISVTLAGGDSTILYDLPMFSDKTIHIFGGTFGDSTVTVLGQNQTSTPGTPTGQPLHQAHDPEEDFSAVAAELLATVLENPRWIIASASAGTGTGLRVVITCSTSRG